MGGPSCPRPGGRWRRERCESSGGCGDRRLPSSAKPLTLHLLQLPRLSRERRGGDGARSRRCRQRGQPRSTRSTDHPGPGVRAVPPQGTGASRPPGAVRRLPGASPPGGCPAHPPPPGFDITPARGARGEKLNPTALSGWFWFFPHVYLISKKC